MRCAVLLLAKQPTPGLVKTRLAAAVGGAAAARLAEAFLRDTLAQLAAVRAASRTIFVDPADAAEWFAQLDPAARVVAQAAGDLGERIAAAFEHAFQAGAERVIALGMDAPHVPAERYEEALALLATHDVVLGPARDGGYYLIGLSRPTPELFRDIDWSTPCVAAQTRIVAARLGLSLGEVRSDFDVDDAADLERLRAHLASGGSAPAAAAELAQLG